MGGRRKRILHGGRRSRLWRSGLVVLALLLGGGSAALSNTEKVEILGFEQLSGWSRGGQAEALSAFLTTCDQLQHGDWRAICALARDVPPGDEASARAFFELLFRPVIVGEPPALFTAYFEPELPGSLIRTPRFTRPIYARPPELASDAPYLTRAQIEAGALSGRGLEIAWLEDPVDVLYLQIQGSGRIRLPNGTILRLGYAGDNGHPYRSVGQEMIRRGLIAPHEASAPSIKAWLRRNPAMATELLNHNPSYVFFRRIKDLPPDKGPLGAMGRSITPLRSIAVDPAFIPLGAPVWIETTGKPALRRLMVAQDTGGVIKGAQRADIFYGIGEEAGLKAGAFRDGGRLVQLLPIEHAYTLTSGK